ncbi:hypothetical protein BH09MYX1_BH09MYX1_42680 [soil metagenome]
MKLRSLAFAALTLGPFALACGDATPAALPPATSSASGSGAASAPPAASSAPPAASSVEVAPKTIPMAELQLASLEASVAALNAHDAKKYVALFTRTAIHKEAATRDLTGRDEIARRMQLLFDAFPDFKFSFDHVWQKGDVVAASWRWTGTDKGSGFMGKRPTNRRVGVQGVTVGFYNIDGLVREVHVYEDGQNLLSQIDPAAKAGSFRAAPLDATTPMDVAREGADEEKNTAVARAFYAALETKKEADTAALFADDATVDDLALPSKPGKGPVAWKALLRSWTGNFSGFTELPLFNLMAVGDTVIVERVLKGQVAPGASVVLHAADVIQLKSGKIAALATYSNTLELVSQVGTKGLRRP